MWYLKKEDWGCGEYARTACRKSEDTSQPGKKHGGGGDGMTEVSASSVLNTGG